MRIGINTRLVIPGKMDGIGWFAAETTQRMAAAHPEHEFYLFYDRHIAPQPIMGANVHPVVLYPQARHPLLWHLYFEYSLPLALRKHKIDLYLSPDGMMPLRPKVPTLTVIHDLNFEHNPDNIIGSHQRFMHSRYPRYVKAAARVATVSEFSRADIAHTYGIRPDKIDVVYDGSHSNYRPLTPSEQQKVRQRFTQGAPYALFVSTILKRKNLTNLLLAFDQLRREQPDCTLKLAVVGKRAWWADELEAAYNSMQFKDEVIFFGHTSADDLAQLMASAEMLVYPSFFEGFGIPILEAMYAETPVIASRTTSMPEVGGDAVLYIDPTQPSDIAQAMALLLDPQRQADLVAKGRVQRTLFSWERTADLLWQSLMKIAPQQ